MANFFAAIPEVFTHEGGYVDDPTDPGGATNYGISARWLKTIPDWQRYDVDHCGTISPADIKALTKLEAETLYYHYWWTPLFNDIRVQAIATKLLDTQVNIGDRPAVKILQHALGFIEDQCDGIFGPQTLAATNSADATTLLARYRQLDVMHYEDLVKLYPSFAKFERGWISRAES